MTSSAKADWSGFGCLVGLGIIAFLIWMILPESWTDPLKYGVIYSVDSGEVQYIDKPKDCRVPRPRGLRAGLGFLFFSPRTSFESSTS